MAKSLWGVGLFGLFGLVVVCGLAQVSMAESEPAEGDSFAATCPISGHAASKDAKQALPNQGGDVYFCCEHCIEAYKKEPKKFALQVSQQLLETGQMVQIGCPMSGNPINKEAMAKAGKADVGFCCEHCLAAYDKADDAEKLKMLFANAKKGFTRQTKCPVSNQPINVEQSAEYKGENVFFCCEHCAAAFAKDPASYEAKLPQLAKQ